MILAYFDPIELKRFILDIDCILDNLCMKIKRKYEASLWHKKPIATQVNLTFAW